MVLGISVHIYTVHKKLTKSYENLEMKYYKDFKICTPFSGVDDGKIFCRYRAKTKKQSGDETSLSQVFLLLKVAICSYMSLIMTIKFKLN